MNIRDIRHVVQTHSCLPQWGNFALYTHRAPHVEKQSKSFPKATLELFIPGSTRTAATLLIHVHSWSCSLDCSFVNLLRPRSSKLVCSRRKPKSSRKGRRHARAMNYELGDPPRSKTTPGDALFLISNLPQRSARTRTWSGFRLFDVSSRELGDAYVNTSF